MKLGTYTDLDIEKFVVNEWAFCALYLLLPFHILAQTPPAHAGYGSRGEIGVFGEYSNDSSHMLLGQARNRKLLDFGV